jgi:NADPH:quinone reductase-like Zn-dependent oxidoreductase
LTRIEGLESADDQALACGINQFGIATGAFAEYAAATEDKLVLKPANVTFEEAAAVPR